MSRFMFKRYLPSILTATLAVGIWGVASAAPQVKSLSLTQSVKTAIEQSPQITLAKIAIQDAQQNLDKVTVDQLLPGYRKGVQAAKDNLFFAQMTLTSTQEDVAAKVEQAYFGVLMAQEAMELKTNNVKQTNKQLALGKAKLKAGLSGTLDVMSLENNLTSAKYALTTAQAGLTIATMKFNRVMGWDLQTAIKLTDGMSFKPEKVDIKAALNYALANRDDIVQSKAALTRRQEDVTLADNSFTPPVELDQAKRELEKAKINLDQVIKDSTIAVQEAYVSLIDSQNNVDIQKRNVTRAKTAYNLTEQKYQVGMAFTNELISAQNDYAASEAQRLQSIYNYRMTLSNFYRTIGKPNPALNLK